MREVIRDAGLNLQVSGQALAKLQRETYDVVVDLRALELSCECEFPTLPSASLENVVQNDLVHCTMRTETDCQTRPSINS